MSGQYAPEERRDEGEGAALACRTWNDVARAVAWEFGLEPLDSELGWVLWNETGFPCFWRTDDPMAELEGQLRDAFSMTADTASPLPPDPGSTEEHVARGHQ